MTNRYPRATEWTPFPRTVCASVPPTLCCLTCSPVSVCSYSCFLPTHACSTWSYNINTSTSPTGIKLKTLKTVSKPITAFSKASYHFSFLLCKPCATRKDLVKNSFMTFASSKYYYKLGIEEWIYYCSVNETVLMNGQENTYSTSRQCANKLFCQWHQTTFNLLPHKGHSQTPHWISKTVLLLPPHHPAFLILG